MPKLDEVFAQVRDGAREILTLAFFYFAAIAAERLFVARAVAFGGSGSVILFATLIIVASIVGFFLRPYLVYRFADDHGRRTVSAVMGTLAVAAPIVVIMAKQLAAMLAGGLVAACALGYCGSAAHAGLARKFGRNAGLAHMAALSYAAGVALQLINNVVVPGEVPSQFIFMVVVIAMIAMLHEQGDRWAATRRARIAAGLPVDGDRRATAADRVLAVRLMIATACLAGAFGLLDSALVASGASGMLELGAGARLVLVAATLAAGVLCGVPLRIARVAGPLLAGLLALAGLVAVAGDAPVWLPVVLLSAGSGFLVVFYTVSFMGLSTRMHMVELWPVMGCAIAYGAGIAGAFAGVPLVGAGGPVAAVAAGAVLLAGTVFVLRGYGAAAMRGNQVPMGTEDTGTAKGAVADQASSEASAVETAATPEPAADGVFIPAAAQPKPADGVPAPATAGPQPVEPASKLSFTERVARFGEAYDLTPRECEILGELLISDESMQEVAGRLYLSRSTLYRHIATMNKKTDTTSRVGLIKAFWLWDETR